MTAAKKFTLVLKTIPIRTFSENTRLIQGFPTLCLASENGIFAAEGNRGGGKKKSVSPSWMIPSVDGMPQIY